MTLDVSHTHTRVASTSNVVCKMDSTLLSYTFSYIVFPLSLETIPVQPMAGAIGEHPIKKYYPPPPNVVYLGKLMCARFLSFLKYRCLTKTCWMPPSY